MSEWIAFRKEDLETIDNLAGKITRSRNINEMIDFAEEIRLLIDYRQEEHR